MAGLANGTRDALTEKLPILPLITLRGRESLSTLPGATLPGEIVVDGKIATYNASWLSSV
jgi:hypothetical protein